MICLQVEVPEEICEIDDELKAIYHSNDCVCTVSYTHLPLPTKA